eukprot:2464686-Amphidinium_carterae.2
MHWQGCDSTGLATMSKGHGCSCWQHGLCYGATEGLSDQELFSHPPRLVPTPYHKNTPTHPTGSQP